MFFPTSVVIAVLAAGILAAPIQVKAPSVKAREAQIPESAFELGGLDGLTFSFDERDAQIPDSFFDVGDLDGISFAFDERDAAQTSDQIHKRTAAKKAAAVRKARQNKKARRNAQIPDSFFDLGDLDGATFSFDERDAQIPNSFFDLGDLDSISVAFDQ
ncbi:MAG: hypothetical protein GOMPHAMPRED_001496 [Gomphillus americanus]|uniref:Uncharacterized protein n=1 Tax=Gomphillus americanus TaxID=1940652 RepID=A0A8H3F626_9LECA|nr:MAG: hypothetical protein GOMPHAMPRED_001496 [Gomphillus americanus]